MLSSTATATALHPFLQESHLHLSIQLEVMVHMTKLYQLYIDKVTGVQLVAVDIAAYTYVSYRELCKGTNELESS